MRLPDKFCAALSAGFGCIELVPQAEKGSMRMHKFGGS
jgi:hypothetical protein